MKQVKNILLLLIALFVVGCTQTIIFEDVNTPTPKPDPVPNDKQLTSAPYAVGDYYYDGTKEGVVFDVWDNGNRGKIVSMTESATSLQWSSDETEQKRLIGADSETDGAYNTAKVKAVSGWQSKYPAFKWCADLGEGWYLPSKEELLTIYNHKDKLNPKLTDKLLVTYWSSTEDDYNYSSVEAHAWSVYMGHGHASSSYKLVINYVRAVSAFGNTQQPEPEPEIDFSTAIDLSVAGTANCYIVSEKGTYMFKPIKGNSSISVGAIFSVVVLWESFGTATTPNVGDIVSTVDYKDGYIAFKTANSFNEGNALIAAKDASDRILWSWHIWFTDQPVEQVYYNNAGTMMDRNLGATSATPGSVGALGLMYQWGRKDPFLGSSSISSDTEAKSTITFPSAVASNSTTGTIEYATANPTTYITGVGGIDSNEDWYYTGTTLTDNTRWTESGSDKSIYDPCPVGWRVPDGGKNGVWSKTLGSSTSFTSSFDYTNKGINFSGKFGEASTIWYPAVGCRGRDSGALMLVGSSSNYWSSSPDPNYVSSIYKFAFYNGDVHLMSIDSRGSSCSVRCVSATPASVPTPEPTEPANNEIWYTSTDGKVVTPAETGYFDVSITSNTYSNGKGVISFSGPLTTIGRNGGEEPFANCAHNLKSVVLPNGLKTIGYGAFSMCSGLESVTIPETVTYIKYGAFYDCDKLTAIALPSELLRIDRHAFFSCDRVESVTIPDSVTLIGEGAFSGEKLRAFYGKYASSDNKLIIVDKTVICAALGGLTEYSIPNTVEKIGFSAFGGYRNIKRFTIPNSVMSIGDGSFNNCSSLQDITIPDSVTEIVGGSFFNCTSLTSAILSKNLTKIGDATFMNCSKLKNIYCSAVTPPQCGKDLFEGVTTEFKIYIPASSVSAYKSASGWSTYADAIVADPVSEPTPEPTEPANNEIWYTSTDGAVKSNVYPNRPYARVYGQSVRCVRE